MPPALLALLMTLTLQDPAVDPSLLTVAERSGFQATARHAEVVALLDALCARSEALVRLSLGATHEGREIPLVVASDPPVRSAEEARSSGKAIVLVFGNIHAGEVCGKEALPMLLRELVLEPGREDCRLLLSQLVLCVAPIYNADGNERMSTTSRPEQDGPAQGQGQRPNAQGLDLNRDYMKLESPEARAMVAFLTEWSPHLVIDTHTTNGSFHRYLLTYAPPLNPSGHPGPIAYVRDRMLPEVSRRLRARTGYDTFLYGNFEPDHGTWATYSSQPRFGAQYHGLRGPMSILTEAYSHAPYEQRVLVTREFVRECLLWAANERGDLVEIARQVAREADAAAALPAADGGPWRVPDMAGAEAFLWPDPVQAELERWRDRIGLRFEPAAAPEPATIKGWVETAGADGKPRPTGEPRDYVVRHLDRFAPTLDVERPFAYLLPARLAAVAEKLGQHGIALQPWQAGDGQGEVEVEVYRIESLTRADEEFQGHHLVSVEVSRRTEARALDEAYLVVPVGQPLGTLAAYLLEPASDDGLVAWNLLDAELEVGADYPVLRLGRAAAARMLAR